MTMPNWNKVQLMGHLTRDIEVRNTQGGTAVANLGLAVNHKWKDKSGEKREEVSFFDCEAWGATAETLAKYLGKGDPVFIDGRLKQDTWEADGQKRSKIKVVIESFQFIGGKREAEPSGPPAKNPSYRSLKETAPIDDDIPF